MRFTFTSSASAAGGFWSLMTTKIESLSTTFSYDTGILVTIDCKIVDVTVATTLVGRSKVSVTVSTVVDVNV